MPTYDYLIIGGGMTGDAAVKGIRQVDQAGTIGLIGNEPDPPYKRPPLTKGLWKGKSIDSVWLKTEKQGIDLLLGREAVNVDPEAKTVADSRGDLHHYDKLLFATGVRPRLLPFGGDGVIAFRTTGDYRRVNELAGERDRFGVIGSGFIGSELSASLASNGKRVTMIFPGEAIGDHMYPPDLAHFLNDYYREKGVTVLAGQRATDLDELGGFRRLISTGENGASPTETDVDGVVSGIGTEPNVELARATGLKIDDGIVVDALLKTNLPGIWAAGDVASYPDAALGRRRVEHEDNAKAMGRRAGRNMAGESEPYTHLPMFYSDLFDLGYEAVGEIDAKHELVADWKTPCREGVIYYLKDGRVRGVLLWGVWNQVDNARALIKAGDKVSAADVKGKIPMES